MKGHKHLTIVIKLGMQRPQRSGGAVANSLGLMQVQVPSSTRKLTNQFYPYSASLSKQRSIYARMGIKLLLSPPVPSGWGYGEWTSRRNRSIYRKFRCALDSHGKLYDTGLWKLIEYYVGAGSCGPVSAYRSMGQLVWPSAATCRPDLAYKERYRRREWSQYMKGVWKSC